MSKVITATLGILLLAGQLFGQAQDGQLLRLATAIKPAPDELKWQKIPWILDLAEAFIAEAYKPDKNKPMIFRVQRLEK